ncbi:MAG: cytosolic protein [Desulfobacterales bacterium RIFOXYA12_FULL_46_15]|nr:MAG: cytosolic protein [Desulfobacterales bacterium RIFOXYA12_FULL_46_15]
MDCNKSKNLNHCNCTYDPCSRKGVCCECIAYHLRNRELPGCCFPREVEQTWDRSFEQFADLVSKGRI